MTEPASASAATAATTTTAAAATSSPSPSPSLTSPSPSPSSSSSASSSSSSSSSSSLRARASADTTTALPALVDALVTRSADAELLSVLDEHELDVAERADDAAEHPYALHVLVLLLVGDVDGARFCFKRVPDARRDADVDAAWRVGAALWQRRLADVPAALDAHAWQGHAATLARRLLAAHRTRALDSLAAAYSAVRVEHTATLLGLDVDACTALVCADAHAWRRDGDVFVPRAPTTRSPRLDAASTLDDLTRAISFLEST